MASLNILDNLAINKSGTLGGFHLVAIKELIGFTGGVNSVGNGHIDYEVEIDGLKKTLRFLFGCANKVNTALNFEQPFSEILFADTSIQPDHSCQTQRTAIKDVTTSNLTFVAGSSDVIGFRYEVWGIL